MIKNEDFYKTKHNQLTKEIEQINIDNKKNLRDLIESLNLYHDIEFNDINYKNWYENLNFDYTKKLSKELQLDVLISTNNNHSELNFKINSICRNDFALFKEFNEVYQIFQRDMITLKENEDKVLSVIKQNSNRITEQMEKSQQIKNNLTEFEFFICGLNFDKIKKILIPNTTNIDSFFENKSSITLLNYSFTQDSIIFSEHNISIENEKNNKTYMLNNQKSTKEKIEEIIKNSFFFKGELVTSFKDFSEFRPKLDISVFVKILEPEILKLNIDSF